jgi:EAL domain-containing protein (putative c-di-GMP-specific phosphodiesterase class I)
MDLDTGRISGVEALARWDRPGVGPVDPSEFIALAEDLGLIDALGELVLRRACAELASWRAANRECAPGFVSVNLSVRQLNNPDLVSVVRNVLDSSGLQGQELCLEITESVLITDPERVLQVLLELKAIGVRMAIDDFGTGYSSLAYLQRFPGDYLKVDRSFVQRLTDGTTGSASAAIVSAVIGMAEAIGLTVVAEGVETSDELAEVRRLGCTGAQGYYLGRPVPAALVPFSCMAHERFDELGA